MKILLIDNGSTFLQDLQWALHSHAVVTVPYSLLNAHDAEVFDAIILSGGHGASVMHAHHVYDAELELVRQTTKPLLGICLGFELLCYAHGETLTRVDEKITGERKLVQITEDPLLKQAPTSVFESHHWVVPNTKHLVTLAVSAYGVEAVRHPTKQHYGVQFHPEKHELTVLQNFLSLASK